MIQWMVCLRIEGEYGRSWQLHRNVGDITYVEQVVSILLGVLVGVCVCVSACVAGAFL